MWIKFIKAKAGLAYFKNDKVDMPAKEAESLIEKGYAVPSEAKPPKSDLPESLPGRSILIGEGLITKEHVLKAKDTLSDLPGIGRKTADQIIEQLNNS